VEKTVDYYMSLPYTVELEFHGEEYRAWVKELPGCQVVVKASESVEELWRLLKGAQRKHIEGKLELGKEVPEPTVADPFWELFEKHFPGYDGDDVRSMLYADGAAAFPLRVLEELWLRVLDEIGLTEVASSGVPPKAENHHVDQAVSASKGKLRPVHLGKSRKGAWVKLDGSRTRYGYKDIQVLGRIDN
jgi:predicted RNase H-like HicB family nuclease